MIIQFVAIITIMMIITFFIQCEDWEVQINYPTLKSVPFEFGVFHKTYKLDDGSYEQEIRIGLIFFVLSFSFFRNDA